MARPASNQPTDGELELLKVLWQHGPAELGVICAELRRQRPVATTTVATMLKVMLDKQLVKRTPSKRRYLWSAKVSREHATRGLVKQLIDRAFDGSAQSLVAHLVEGQKLSDEDRRQILSMVAGESSAVRKAPADSRRADSSDESSESK
jgi:BlaI family transcriptional regulator, penicillinase repressor